MVTIVVAVLIEATEAQQSIEWVSGSWKAGECRGYLEATTTRVARVAEAAGAVEVVAVVGGVVVITGYQEQKAAVMDLQLE